MKNKALITPEMKSSPSVFAEAQAFRKSANLVLRPLASTIALLRGFNRRTSEDRRGRHQLRIRIGKRGPGARHENLAVVRSRWNIKRKISALYYTARLAKRLLRGLLGAPTWKDFGLFSAGQTRRGRASTCQLRTVIDPITGDRVYSPKAPSRRDNIRANARSHQSLKGCAA